MRVWTGEGGKKFEMKTKNGEWWYRTKGEGENNWKKGTPPGFSQKPMKPLT